jgi:hypothetical protein
VQCLLELFKQETPVICCVRGGSYATVIYGCGYASGLGFGSTFVAGLITKPLTELLFGAQMWMQFHPISEN